MERLLDALGARQLLKAEELAVSMRIALNVAHMWSTCSVATLVLRHSKECSVACSAKTEISCELNEKKRLREAAPPGETMPAAVAAGVPGTQAGVLPVQTERTQGSPSSGSAAVPTPLEDQIMHEGSNNLP